MEQKRMNYEDNKERHNQAKGEENEKTCYRNARRNRQSLSVPLRVLVRAVVRISPMVGEDTRATVRLCVVRMVQIHHIRLADGLSRLLSRQEERQR